MTERQWARPGNDGKCVEIVDFDPAGKFHADIRFYPVPAELVGWIDYQYTWNGAAWLEPSPGYTVQKIMTATQQQFTDAIQAHLDAFAKTRGYDSIHTAATYDGDPDPVFAAEGRYAKEARGATWRKGYEILNAVLAGERPMPTLEEVLAELPGLAWPEGVS